MNQQTPFHFDETRSAAIEVLLSDVVESRSPARTSSRLPRAGWVAVGAAAILILTGGAAVAVHSATVTRTQYVACFARAQINADGSFPGTSVSSFGSDGKPASISDAVGLCSDMWSQGILDSRTANGMASVNTTGSVSPRAVPSELSVCVMTDGAAAVVPGPKSVCAEIGLAIR
jgi:hypothetical protein